MATLRVEFVTADREVLSREEADFVKAPGIAGELGILPHHIPLLTPLRAGEVVVQSGSSEEYFFVAGGFLEVRPDKVVILADAAERAEDIDEARAQEAKRRAESLKSAKVSDVETAEATAALERAILRLQVAQLRKRRQGSRSHQQ